MFKNNLEATSAFVTIIQEVTIFLLRSRHRPRLHLCSSLGGDKTETKRRNKLIFGLAKMRGHLYDYRTSMNGEVPALPQLQ